MKIGERIKTLRETNKMTQEDLAKILKTTKQNIYKYENGIITNIPSDKIELMSKKFGCSPAYLMGWESGSVQKQEDVFRYGNVSPIVKKKIPFLGKIACGQPIFADEEKDAYFDIELDIDADFCLRCKGDSMINADIKDGYVVFIRKQDIVENGEIAAVIIGEEVTLKRVYYYKEENLLILRPENSKYKEMRFKGEELNEIRILGKAVAFQGKIE